MPDSEVYKGDCLPFYEYRQILVFLKGSWVSGGLFAGYHRGEMRGEHQIGGIKKGTHNRLSFKVTDTSFQSIADYVAVAFKNCMVQAFEEILPNVTMVVVPVLKDSWG